MRQSWCVKSRGFECVENGEFNGRLDDARLDMAAGQTHEMGEIHRLVRLELFDDPIAAAFRFERRDDAAFDHQANVAIGGVAIDFGDTLILRGRKGLAVAIGVSEQAALAQIDLIVANWFSQRSVASS